MSTDIYTLQADTREAVGKQVKALRDAGHIPATMYEKGKESTNLQVEYVPFVKAWQTVGLAQPVELTVAGKKHLTMIKDVHVDPSKNTYLHVAFHAVNKNDPVEAEVPVHIDGDVPAEMTGNFIVRPNDHIIIKALPGDLPEMLHVSAAKLVEPGDHITVADIEVIKGIEILSEPEMILATVEEPRVQEEEPEAAVDAADVPSAHGAEADKQAE